MRVIRLWGEGADRVPGRGPAVLMSACMSPTGSCVE